MPAYYVTLNQEKGGYTLMHGANAMVVFAADATQAKEICSAKYGNDGAAWAVDATATEIVADADFEGWVFAINIWGGVSPIQVSVTGTAANNTIDEIGALLVTALNATAAIAGAAYNSTSQLLTIAETTDGLGDLSVEVTITPPGGNSGIASLVGTITDGGASGDALSVVLPADAAVIPIVALVAKQV